MGPSSTCRRSTTIGLRCEILVASSYRQLAYNVLCLSLLSLSLLYLQIDADPSTDWAHYQKRYLPLYQRLKKEVTALTEPKPIPPAAFTEERPLTLAYVDCYGLSAPSTVLPHIHTSNCAMMFVRVCGGACAVVCVRVKLLMRYC
jgi:hypothetical protein